MEGLSENRLTDSSFDVEHSVFHVLPSTSTFLPFVNCVCVYSQVLQTRLQAPALMMTTAGIWMKIKSGSKSNSFYPKEDTMALGNSSTPCSLRYTLQTGLQSCLFASTATQDT